MSRVIDPVGRNWRTEEKADYSTILKACRCGTGGDVYDSARYGGGCVCGSTASSQVRIHCNTGI